MRCEILDMRKSGGATRWELLVSHISILTSQY